MSFITFVKKNVFVLILLLANVGSLPAFAEEYLISVRGNEELNCKFEDNRVNAIYKDSDGFVWIGTGTTVERVGGRHSLAYHFWEEKTRDNYSPFLVNTLLEVRKHELWVGTIQGVWRTNHEEHKMERLFADKINFSVQALAKDEAGHVYIATVNGLYIYDGESLRRIVVDEKNALSTRNLILDVAIVDSENVWLLTADGLVLCNSQSGALKFYLCPSALHGHMSCLTQLGNVLYLGTNTGEVYSFDCQKRRYKLGWKGPQVPVAALDAKNGMLGVATRGEGIFLLSASSGEVLYKATHNGETGQGLLSNMISSILLSDNEIWCGTDYYQGMNLLRKEDEVIQKYDKNKPCWRNMYIRSFLRTPSHTFIGTREGFYYVDEATGSCTLINKAKSGGKCLRSNLIFSFFECGDEVWVGTCGGGLAVFNPRKGTFRETPLTRVCVSNDIFMCEDDPEKDWVWLAASDGLYAYNKQTEEIREYNASNSGMPGNIVYGFFRDSKGCFWLGTDKGLALFHPETGQCTQEGLPAVCCDRAVRSIYEGRDGTLFVCMLDNRVIISDGALQQVRPLELFSGHTVMQDDEGRYWLGGDDGLLRMDENLQHYQLVGLLDGLSVSPGMPIVKDKQGDLWIGTSKGLYVVNPHREPLVPEVRITDMWVNGMQRADVYSMQPDSVLTLDAAENTVTFQFLSLRYREAGQNRYQYKLEGKEPTWIDLNGEDRVTFFNLPAGEYTFRVRSFLNEESEDAVTFRIASRPLWPVYAGIGGGVLVVFICWTFFRRRKQASAFVPSVEVPPVELPQESVSEEKPVEETPVPPIADSYGKLSPEEAEEVIAALRKYMHEEEAYLNVDLKQSDVAIAIGYPTYLLSAVFTHYLRTGYYDFVNGYRVDRFKQAVAEGLHKKYTLVTLAEKCGFKSKASFFRAFKKFVGSTPSEYIQQHEDL